MSRPLLLDLFCGAGGAAVGYARAGFEVVGVDMRRQPRYPFAFEGPRDALEYLADRNALDQVDAIHASPPCQAYSALATMHPGRAWPDLVGPTRDLLREVGLPYVLENVAGSPLRRQSTFDEPDAAGILLCGTMFGLGVARGELRRHRLFESNVPLEGLSCRHSKPAVGAYGHGANSGKPRMLSRDEASAALGIDWMNRDEMAEAIPPAYTEFVGRQVLRVLEGATV